MGIGTDVQYHLTQLFFCEVEVENNAALSGGK